MSAILHINTSKLFDRVVNLLFKSLIDFSILYPFCFFIEEVLHK